MSTRLDVKKTYKLYIGGKFPRSESGRYKESGFGREGGVQGLAAYCRLD